MLGSTVARLLSEKKINVVEANRTGIPSYPSNLAIKFECSNENIREVLISGNFDYVVNCIGVIKQAMSDSLEDSLRAISINSRFPFQLSRAAIGTKSKIISIGTDCVFSGKRGRYSESDVHDPTDIYGKTKSLGEVTSDIDMILRCSIIGKEISTKRSLLEWVINQPLDSRINGFIDHNWNGLTTLHFAKIVYGVITEQYHKPLVSHIVPSEIVNKDYLVRNIATIFNRPDIEVTGVQALSHVDRSLVTIRPELNNKLWKIAGYNQPPSIKMMLVEYVNWLEGNQHV